ncbi:hypothetical protein PENTCL1PPCAC_2795, partial [Pristionchus entomophagus]
SGRIYEKECSDVAYEQFKRDHGKKSSSHDSARQHRLCAAIADNAIHNAHRNVTFKRGVNALSDYSSDEYRQLLGYRPHHHYGPQPYHPYNPYYPYNPYNPYYPYPVGPPAPPATTAAPTTTFDCGQSLQTPSSSTVTPPNNGQIPDSLDWRDAGVVTAVKNQGTCGACWAFSTTGAIESQYAMKYAENISLSEQNLMDCSTQNYGCQGGNMAIAMQYIAQNGGVDTESGYPYLGYQSNCRYSTASIGGRDTGYVPVTSGDENALKIAVATIGPISVAFDASHSSFQSYQSGVYYEPYCSSTVLDHAILVIGYGTDPEMGDYWLIKNSWGTSWGEEGFGRMARNRGNNCGIATEAVYPLV